MFHTSGYSLKMLATLESNERYEPLLLHEDFVFTFQTSGNNSMMLS
jgi:hypothetical protein